MNPCAYANIGPVQVTRLGLGTAPLGNLFSVVDDTTAAETVSAAWSLGIRYFDTAPLYGYGTAERRLGAALRSQHRDDYALETKVGRLLRDPSAGSLDVDGTQEFEGTPFYKGTGRAVPVFDYSYDGALRALEESLARLGTDHVDLVHVHDPDAHVDEAIAGAFPALLAMREQNVVRAIGVATDFVETAVQVLEQVDLDAVLIAGRWTLLDHSALDRLLPLALSQETAVIAASVFNSGVLAQPDRNPTFDYVPAGADVLAKVAALATTCTRFGVPLPAVALQFPSRHPAVAATLVGARTPDEIAQNVEFAQLPIPDDLWETLADECGIPLLSEQRGVLGS